jgi:hypothetical protein
VQRIARQKVQQVAQAIASPAYGNISVMVNVVKT